MSSRISIIIRIIQKILNFLYALIFWMAKAKSVRINGKVPSLLETELFTFFDVFLLSISLEYTLTEHQYEHHYCIQEYQNFDNHRDLQFSRNLLLLQVKFWTPYIYQNALQKIPYSWPLKVKLIVFEYLNSEIFEFTYQNLWYIDTHEMPDRIIPLSPC